MGSSKAPVVVLERGTEQQKARKRKTCCRDELTLTQAVLDGLMSKTSWAKFEYLTTLRQPIIPEVCIRRSAYPL